jgi:hypothetical protein
MGGGFSVRFSLFKVYYNRVKKAKHANIAGGGFLNEKIPLTVAGFIYLFSPFFSRN